ncbi:MAG: zinc ribbon domain-containing protein [Oscillatoria princeps RMCB-10]|jgi:hypothetical protein|nr:zinc ribbon domain-containing protein [Oscillatoria princeps RMCB-10]
MPECPKCHQPTDSLAIACPYCRTELKAYGHPGIPLYRSSSEEFLCDSCIYHEDGTCNFPQRPYAKTCTLYHNKSQPLVELPASCYRPSLLQLVKAWCRRNPAVLILVGLGAISFLLALSRR